MSSIILYWCKTMLGISTAWELNSCLWPYTCKSCDQHKEPIHVYMYLSYFTSYATLVYLVFIPQCLLTCPYNPSFFMYYTYMCTHTFCTPTAQMKWFFVWHLEELNNNYDIYIVVANLATISGRSNIIKL
jgi:hypothetical protein